jgi:glutamate synthase domain-containing protein 2
MAYETIYDLIDQGLVTDIVYEKAKYNYIKASASRAWSRSARRWASAPLQSYCGAQIFEALGLSQALVDKYFTWTPTRIGRGIGLNEIYHEVRRRHSCAPTRNATTRPACSSSGGDYQWRARRRRHLFTPITIHKLQAAVRTRGGDVWQRGFKTFKEYSGLVNQQERKFGTLRGLLELRWPSSRSRWTRSNRSSAIVKRFKTGAMSYGSISKEAHETMASP